MNDAEVNDDWTGLIEGNGIYINDKCHVSEMVGKALFDYCRPFTPHVGIILSFIQC